MIYWTAVWGGDMIELNRIRLPVAFPGHGNLDLDGLMEGLAKIPGVLEVGLTGSFARDQMRARDIDIKLRVTTKLDLGELDSFLSVEQTLPYVFTGAGPGGYQPLPNLKPLLGVWPLHIILDES